MNSFTKTHCVQCKVYYGSEERQGMCSVCFKEFKNNQGAKVEPTQLPVQSNNVISNEISVNSTNQISPVEDVKMEEVKSEPVVTEPVVTKPVQTNPHACWICNKRVGYLGFKCKCDYIFCGTHRHFSDHNCEFDYKSYDREKLKSKNNLGEEQKTK
jgi:hypothetical protein